MALNQNLYFGRYTTLEVKNFNTGNKITIPDDFKITFEFYKTIDEVNEASTGSIQIHGLSLETYNALGDAGGEILLSTGYVHGVVKPLFYASITEKNRTYSEGNYVTNLNVSANFSYYRFGAFYVDNKNSTLFTILQSFASSVEANVSFILDNIPKEHQAKVSDWVSNAQVNYTESNYGFGGLRAMCQHFGLTMYTDIKPKSPTMGYYRTYKAPKDNLNSKGQAVEENEIARDTKYDEYEASNPDSTETTFYFRFKNSTVDRVISNATGGWKNLNYANLSDKTTQAEKDLYSFNIMNEEESDDTAIVIGKETGLASAPTQMHKLILAPENWVVKPNEEITRKGEETVMARKSRDEARVQKYRERQAKAAEKGKTIKPLKPRKAGKVQINRTYIEFKAFINPDVKPQSQIKLVTQEGHYDGIYRVRSVKFSGNNKDGSNLMTVLAEDSSGKYDTVATEKEIQEYQTKGDMESNISGSLGNNTGFGEDSPTEVEEISGDE